MLVLYRKESFAQPPFVFEEETRRMAIETAPAAVWRLLNTQTAIITGSHLTRWAKWNDVTHWSIFPKLEYIANGSYHCLERFEPTGAALGDYDIYVADGTVFKANEDAYSASRFIRSLAMRGNGPVTLICVSGYYPRRLPYLARYAMPRPQIPARR